MSEWKEVIASDFCTEVTDGTHDSPKPVNVGKYLLTSKHLQEYSLDFANAYMISQEDYDKAISRSKVDQYDILFSMIGTIGTTHRVTIPNVDFAVKNMGIFKLGGDCLKSKWLYYWLKTRVSKEYINSCLSGTTQGYMTLKALRNFPISVPDPLTMGSITSILSSLDDKIAVNKKICENLEAQAQALFKHWFVDFAPFKDGKFVESELGMIPEGWKVGTLSDLGEIVCGKTPAKANKAYYGNEIPFIKIPDMRNNIFIISSEDNLSLEGSESQINKLLPEFSILVSCIATVGLVSINTSPAHTNQQINSIIPFDIRYRYYLYEYLKLQEKYLLVLGSSGTTTFNVNTKTFSNIQIIIPNIETFDNFHNLVFQSFDEILNRSKESSRLSTLRDTLLPKLMSGEIKVNEIEKSI